MKRIVTCLFAALLLCASTVFAEEIVTPGNTEDRGFVLDNVLHHPERGDIHFSLYIPATYDGSQPVPLCIALPGWGGLYFQGVGADLRWETLPFAARDHQPDMIIASAQLNDWGTTSAQDTIVLTEYLLSTYTVDPDRVYLSGLSGGGETGSLVMGLRPDLYAAYLMVASQWDGNLTVLSAERTPVYMIIGENDSYYGSSSLKQAHAELTEMYREQGLTDAEISDLLVLNVKPDTWFTERGYADQHGAAVAFSDEPGLLDWIFNKNKGA